MRVKLAMLDSSAMTVLPLPGMMLEPGCSAGRRISSKPVEGPEASKRKSLATRVMVMANVRSAAEKSTASAMDCMLSNRFSAGCSSRPVSAERRLTISL